MADRISRYRVVRLAIHVPTEGHHLAQWSLIAIGVKKGIPDARMLDSGVVPLTGPSPSYEQILEALDSLIGSRFIGRE